MGNHILVTGDLVLDCHLYGGVKTAATSFSEPGTEYLVRPGGAALTAELIHAAADSNGLAWDMDEKAWRLENEKRKKDNTQPLPRPDNHEEERPKPIFKTELSLEATGLETDLPTNLKSFGVWTPHSLSRESKDVVWRIANNNHFGYGPNEREKSGCCFKQAAIVSPEPPALTVIDDGGILFRHKICQSVWPDFSKGPDGQILLKMSGPLCRGDLWAELAPAMNRLTVIVSARDLRLEDAQINARLSWEQCVDDTITALNTIPFARDLLNAAHTVVNFGSAGALWFERGQNGSPSNWRLLFDAELLEGDHSRKFDGTSYGFQTCLAAGIGYHLMQSIIETNQTGPSAGQQLSLKAMQLGIAAGLNARRMLLELGHGKVGKQPPGFPVNSIGQCIAESSTGFALANISGVQSQNPGCPWSILVRSEASGETTTAPLIGLAELTARYGPSAALSDVPALHLGNLFTVDRSEIESLRTIEALINSYESAKVQKKPLSIGVFGPPGAGKSFAVKVVVESILGPKAPFIEFNLSQFKSPAELIGAFHRIRDAVLKGVTPVAFWDEFDSQKYRWLQYLLAPMQDGAFQHGEITHPIGKCIFIFAGGTSPTMESFGVAEPQEFGEDDLKSLPPEIRELRIYKYREQSERFLDFKLLKGPDFLSRLHGYLNVLGPNPRTGANCHDPTWPIRRALILRGILKLKDKAELNMDSGLLHALLGVSSYRHGARSFEKILETLLHGGKNGRLNRSALPPQALLARETDAENFYALLSQGDAFRNHPNLEDLAAAIHYKFLSAGEKSQIEAERKAAPNLAWMIDPSIKKSYDKLSDDAKAANRAAAQRIPDHLALIGYLIVPQTQGDDGSWRAPLESAIKKHIDRLAKAEHLGWCSERIANGWAFAPQRDNHQKRHNLLKPWAQLSPADQDKDRSGAVSIPELLETAKFKAVPIK